MSVCSRRLTLVIVYLMFLVSVKLIGQASFSEVNTRQCSFTDARSLMYGVAGVKASVPTQKPSEFPRSEWHVKRRGRKAWLTDVAERRGRKAWLKDVAARCGRKAWPEGVVGKRGRKAWSEDVLAGIAGSHNLKDEVVTREQRLPQPRQSVLNLCKVWSVRCWQRRPQSPSVQGHDGLRPCNALCPALRKPCSERPLNLAVAQGQLSAVAKSHTIDHSANLPVRQKLGCSQRSSALHT